MVGGHHLIPCHLISRLQCRYEEYLPSLIGASLDAASSTYFLLVWLISFLPFGSWLWCEFRKACQETGINAPPLMASRNYATCRPRMQPCDPRQHKPTSRISFWRNVVQRRRPGSTTNSAFSSSAGDQRCCGQCRASLVPKKQGRDREETRCGPWPSWGYTWQRVHCRAHLAILPILVIST